MMISAGGDPRAAVAGDFGQSKPVTIGADDSIEEATRTMGEHQVRRLPVIDAGQVGHIGGPSHARQALRMIDFMTETIARLPAQR